MIFQFSSIKFIAIFSIVFFVSVSTATAQADDGGGISVSPSRLEVIIVAGTERTVGIAVDYTRDIPDTELPTARLIARLEDWSLNEDGSIRFAPINTLERTASPWVTFGPAEFSLAAEKRQILRYTISVPKDTKPGDYLFACYIENRIPPPPPRQGEKRIVLNFRYYTMFYVMVPNLTREGELQALETTVVNGEPVVSPTLGNKGNSRLRPKHSVEIRDATDKILFSSPMSDAMVVLGGHRWKMPFTITIKLPTGKYTLAYTVDFGDKSALQRGKSSFEISEADVIARQKLSEKIAAKTETDDTPVSPPKESAVAAKPSDSPPIAVKDKETSAQPDNTKADEQPDKKKPR